MHVAKSCCNKPAQLFLLAVCAQEFAQQWVTVRGAQRAESESIRLHQQARTLLGG
ncbi:hypothetical protein BAUCODRAFT_39178 [Baudoinia panamericana UAMH 10762]|uniref:Uncharacterized protein n=1 Tax=Baudoinia panamericana (strain UAMH 10762) TaxID=717646 RepID=M2LB66_BAUPA|nr:uncharacterized protein BAUCODRAFT_39178 [Baudoinia panamericana UAMH 10762]EMC91052.1 hypothetical protein BAUCODRAFT_39178 [Baudoinia panamericana UAMH 10762]